MLDCTTYCKWYSDLTLFGIHSDVLCGQLQCIPGTFQNNAGVSVIVLTVGVIVGFTQQQCQ